ncbi:MAG: hypothetical protein K2L95_05040 [Alphaproteobacteria bacterium]|nr:hypothetical protein [Alphaproteobacteria bacterium]MDE6571548.1 hypothetical protein [Alphaproteobacteria bacterium]
MEQDGEMLACCGQQKKICQNCESSTRDYNTGKLYCCDVSWLRMVFWGPRPVMPTDTCHKIALRKKLNERTR